MLNEIEKFIVKFNQRSKSKNIYRQIERKKLLENVIMFRWKTKETIF